MRAFAAAVAVVVGIVSSGSALAAREISTGRSDIASATFVDPIGDA